MNEIFQAIRDIVSEKQPENDISELLFRHNCFYLLSLMKTETKWTALAKNTVTFNHIAAKEKMKALSPFLKRADFPYAIIKGPVLSQGAYGSCGFRKSGDLDLLVAKESWKAARACLLDAGFVQGKLENDAIVPYSSKEKIFYSAFTHQYAPFLKAAANPFCPFVNVDVNTSVLWGEADFSIDESSFLQNLQPAETAGVSCMKLEPYHEFIALCLHHYKDMNSIYLLSAGPISLKLFCDIYFYLRNNKLEPKELNRRCAALGAAEYVYYCIYFTNVIFKSNQLDAFLNEMKTEKAEALIPCFGLNKKERKFWKISFADRIFALDFKEKFLDTLMQEDFDKIDKNNRFLT